MSVDATLQERGSRYGTIEGNASTTQAMMDVVAQSPRAGELTDVHMECLHMIFHKIARMVNGDPWYADNAHDIAGYAKLLEDYLTKESERIDAGS